MEIANFIWMFMLSLGILFAGITVLIFVFLGGVAIFGGVIKFCLLLKRACATVFLKAG